MFVFFRDLAILRYTNSTRCGFIVYKYLYWIYVLTISKLKVANCSRFPFCLVESNIYKNCHQSSNSMKQFLEMKQFSEESPCNKTTLLDTKIGLTQSHQSSSNFIVVMFSAKDGPHSSRHKWRQIIRKKMEASNLQTPGMGKSYFKHFHVGKKCPNILIHTQSHIFSLFVDHHFGGPHVCRVRLQRFCGR